MEAPEKIYMTPSFADPDNVLLASFSRSHLEFHRDIEYTRTDTFIEKACEWIERNMDDYIYVEYDTATGMPTNEAHIAYKKVVEDFKNFMKGE